MPISIPQGVFDEESRTDARPCRHRHHPGGGPQRLRVNRIVRLVPFQLEEPERGGHLVFAQCMREKGFDVPDTGLTPDQLNDHDPAFDSALNECMVKVSGMTGEDNVANDPAAREAMVKAAQCLREAGYDVKDPQAGEGISVKDIPEDVLNKCFQQSGAAK